MFFVMTENGEIINLLVCARIFVEPHHGKFRLVARCNKISSKQRYIILNCDAEEKAENAMRMLFKAINDPSKNGWNAIDFKDAAYVPVIASAQRPMK